MPDRFTYTNQFFDGPLPLEGGKINFYEPGTTNPKDTYADAALTTPNDNPVELDAEGYIPNIFLALGDYDIVITDQFDIPIPEGTKTIEGRIAPSAQVPIPVGADSGKILNIDGNGDYQLSTTIRGASVAYTFANTSGGQVLTALDEGAVSANDANPYLGFSYATTVGGAVIRTGYVGDFSTGNNDIYLGADLGSVRVIGAADAYLTATTGAVNIAATAGAVNLTAGTGAINLSPSTGILNVTGNSTNSSAIRLFEDTDNGTNYIGLAAPASVAANVTFILPVADGTSGQYMKTDASGNLSFGTPYQPVKAWINFTVTAGVIATISGFNISSLTRNNTGDYTLTFPAMADANYLVIVNGKQVGGNGIVGSVKNGTTNTTTSTTFQTWSTANSLVDPANVYVTIIGN